MKKKLKVIIDTNLWISYLLTNNYSFLDELLENDKISLIFSEELLSELIDVLKRPKFKAYFNNSDIDILLASIENFSTIVHVVSDVQRCRDIKDNFLLSLAKDSKADFLLTGDKDLLILHKIFHTKIITISEFKKIIK